jgi:hypothetical protein
MKKVFEYMGWKYTYPHKTVYDSLNERHNLDGNDMVEAINKMVEAAGVEPDAIRASIGLELCLTLI